MLLRFDWWMRQFVIPIMPFRRRKPWTRRQSVCDLCLLSDWGLLQVRWNLHRSCESDYMCVTRGRIPGQWNDLRQYQLPATSGRCVLPQRFLLDHVAGRCNGRRSELARRWHDLCRQQWQRNCRCMRTSPRRSEWRSIGEWPRSRDSSLRLELYERRTCGYQSRHDCQWGGPCNTFERLDRLTIQGDTCNTWRGVRAVEGASLEN